MLPANDATTTTTTAGGGREGGRGRLQQLRSAAAATAATGIVYRSPDYGQPRATLVAKYATSGNYILVRPRRARDIIADLRRDASRGG